MNSKQIINGCLLPLTIIIVMGFCIIIVMVLGRGIPNLQANPQPSLDTPQPVAQATPPSNTETTPTPANTEPSPTPTRVVTQYETSTSTATPSPLPTPTPLVVETPTARPPPQPSPTSIAIKYVVIISIDGLRPDALDLVDTPTLDGLRAKGAYSAKAKTVTPTATLIAHASMLGGMIPDKHGIYWNLYSPELGKIKGPTAFSVAHKAGLNTAIVAGKIKLEQIYLPHPAGLFNADFTNDGQIKDKAISLIQDPAGLPTILFIHLPDVDNTGHKAGWMSTDQLNIIHQADTYVGDIVAALDGAGYLENTLLIITADHGGHDKTHLILPPLPEDSTIPWLAVGPGIPAGVILPPPINIYDTAATTLDALQLPIPKEWDGKSIFKNFF